MTKKETIKELMAKYKGRFSVELGIDLRSRKPAEIFKWFLSSVLFGARISETIAIKTYKEFEQGLLSPRALLDAGWDGLVAVLDRGGYVRYDFKTATKLLDMSRALQDQYQDDLNILHASASGPEDLELRLKSLAKGIGDLTVNIFLREMRSIWEKAGSLPVEVVVMAAKSLGIVPKDIADTRKILALLMKAWRDAGMKLVDFPDFEAALVRYGKEQRRKKNKRNRESKHRFTQMNAECLKY
jgi:endonuclease III